MRELTLSAAIEFDSDLLVHVFAQIEDVLLLRPLLLLMATGTTTASASSTATSSTTSAPSSLRSSIVVGHGRVASKGLKRTGKESTRASLS